MNQEKIFSVTYNEKQEKNLKNAGFTGLANDPDGLDTIFYLFKLADYLQHHNKNYTKSQYEKITAIYDVLQAIENGI